MPCWRRKVATRTRLTTTTGKAGILRAQVLLLRAHYSSGEIDGLSGSNLAKGRARLPAATGAGDRQP